MNRDKLCRLGNQAGGHAGFRHVHLPLCLAMIAICVFAAASGSVRAAEYDSYAVAGDTESVVVGAMSAPEDVGFDVMPQPVPSACRGSACKGCRHCAKSPSGIINRILGPACPRWTGQADVLLLWQGNVPSTPLLTLDAAPFPSLLNANEVGSGLGSGPRVALMLNVDQCHAIEANYFNAGNLVGNKSFTAPPEGQMAWAALGGYPVGNINDGVYSNAGRIQSFELNWRRYNGKSVTWLAGFRWVEWDDSLSITDNYDDGILPGVDTLNARAVNNLYGAQIGADATLLTLFDVVRFNGVGKAGVYGNADASTTMSVGGDRIPAATYAATGNSTGFFGEIGINGSVQITEHLFWRAGYNFFWISGVATSLNQLHSFDMSVPDGQLKLGGSVFLQGVNTGIEARW